MPTGKVVQLVFCVSIKCVRKPSGPIPGRHCQFFLISIIIMYMCKWLRVYEHKYRVYKSLLHVPVLLQTPSLCPIGFCIIVKYTVRKCHWWRGIVKKLIV